MDNQSFTDFLHGDAELNDLWPEGHGEQHINLAGYEEQHIDLEECQETTPPVKSSGKKARVLKDPIIGVDQSRDCYWKRINAYFHANKTEDSDRTQGSLQHRWAVIQEQMNKFCACYDQVLNRNQSGMTHDNKLSQALAKYASDVNKSFGLMHCFDKLRDTEKWKSRPKLKKQKISSLDTPFSSSASVFEDEATSPSKDVPMKRPIGAKRAKEALRRSKSSSNTGNSSAMDSFGEILETRESKRQERFELMIAMDKQREEERLAEEKNKLTIKKKIALEEEKIQIMIMAEERMTTAEDSRIMSMDISGMGEEEQEFYKIRKSQIMKRHRNLL